MSGDVVTLNHPYDGIALIQMCDQEGGNTFTASLLRQLQERFAAVEEDESVRAVVLTGVGPYFCCGGTRESLIDLHAGRSTFLGENSGAAVYSLPLSCPVPVIAAMQGHAIGGGLSLGLFADSAVLAAEGVYGATFMKYGFTPGFGSTLVFPARLGQVLGNEMLLSAKTYRGVELGRRGVPYPVVTRSDVVDEALQLARVYAERPRHSLIILKDALVADLRARLASQIEIELVMHERTIHRPEVAERLATLYDG
ncbi:polyketide synthase [Actinomyces timonensis]|jgi:batE|uniref:polyketide synthase n=1 Tax=Actinomyces timonensis TaxID=1288391 RepID=UPI0002F41D60|nr:polyketide synthase [Actinomyces timonensis]